MYEVLRTRLARTMEMRGMSMAETSRKSGASSGLVRAIVAGEIETPRWSTLEKLASSLDVSPEYLVGRIDTLWPPTRSISAKAISIVGRIAAGNWIDPEQETAPAGEVLIVPPQNYLNNDLVAFDMGDDSASTVCPQGGQVIAASFASLNETAKDGQYVVVESPMTGSSIIERTIRKYRIVSGTVILEPLSPRLQPVKLNPSMVIDYLVVGSVFTVK